MPPECGHLTLISLKIRAWYKEQMGSISGARSGDTVDDNSPTAATQKP